MLRISILFALFLFALAGYAATPAFQQSTLGQFGPPGSVKGGQQGYFQIDSSLRLNVQFNAVVEPPLTNPDELKIGWGVFRSQKTWHRFVIDKVHGQYFGYDLTVGPIAGGFNQYRVTFAPLTIGPEQLQPPDLSPLPLPSYPEPQKASAGETIAVDLLVSPDGKRKIVDYIQIRFDGPVSALTKTHDQPKDYTPDDGPLTFDFVGDVLVNGQKFQGPTWFSKGKHGGATLWFSFGGRGRYILSLSSREGFFKLGAIRGNVVSFRADGQSYEIRMNAPVVDGGGTWSLYVLYDPSYRPSPADLQVLPPGVSFGNDALLGGVDRLENLVPK